SAAAFSALVPSMTCPACRPPLFPYTTLFRSPFSKSIYDNITFALKRHGLHDKEKLDEIVETTLKQASLWDQVKDDLNKSALALRSEEHTSELQSRFDVVCRLLLAKTHLAHGR